MRDIIHEMTDLVDQTARLEYTRKAFGMLPQMDAPEILDVGCGVGEPTLELARLTNGKVTGIDIDQWGLDRLKSKAEEEGLLDRVKALNMSMLDMDFPDEAFDVIWAEASIWFIGFEKGLREWRRFIKPDRFMVVHEMCWLRPDPPEEMKSHWDTVYPGIRTIPEYVDAVLDGGYDTIGGFALPDGAWWIMYFNQLGERIDELRSKYRGDPSSLAILDEQQMEMELLMRFPNWYGSVFLLMGRK
jgi:SAM-dependent methyltransferase